MLGGLDHLLIEMRLTHVGRGNAEVEVDTVNANEEFAERAVFEDFLTVLPYDREAAVAQHAAELNDVDILVFGQRDRSLQ